MLSLWHEINIFAHIRLESMDEVNRSHTNERTKLISDIDETETSITSCEGSVKGLEERYCFFQEMRGYVRDLVECLNEKVGFYAMLGGKLNVCVGGNIATLLDFCKLLNGNKF